MKEKEVIEKARALAMKFIGKVESGRAQSKETYGECKDLLMAIQGCTSNDEVIYNLWKIIDNIDTFGDMAKSDDKAFRKMVEKEQKKRWDFLPEDEVERLYDLYHPNPDKDTGPIPRNGSEDSPKEEKSEKSDTKGDTGKELKKTVEYDGIVNVQEQDRFCADSRIKDGKCTQFRPQIVGVINNANVANFENVMLALNGRYVRVTIEYESKEEPEAPTTDTKEV